MGAAIWASSILLDLDHFTPLFQESAGRGAHIPLFVGAVYFAIYNLACLGRLLVRLVLGEHK